MRELGANTIRVLLFMTLAILVFNFYPVTAVMIVLLALLNDGAILAIAYDRARYSDKPEVWNMSLVLGVASVLGFVGLIASFGIFYLAEEVFHLSRDMTQTLMYLKLSVAGHLTIFITRTRGHFWSYRPAPILVGAGHEGGVRPGTPAICMCLITWMLSSSAWVRRPIRSLVWT